ncbi:signal peptidase I [Erysipelothrix rhusiopathiae]|uniref:Signal peptidase I n=2 Tax=Erysipelothrix TaxID=1647 RepID=E7FTR8_ERYRH|nr:signal peptidase I [Erysipelothrix rhusiopathiae]UPU39225.1 signal peptidase I [Erysipelothrix sp. Poltava]CAH2761713.1 signal peptidase I [Erysipelothrix sp. A18Y020d]AGN23746.1 signal peptidase I [Erysipelothrix rhusiopathiae SY1027]AMS11482.1 signal peptidase I [Erysipelothrix rhusiopathiae]AOO67980.1 signal peptidase I [Erysipelothrix rhusiopathiae]
MNKGDDKFLIAVKDFIKSMVISLVLVILVTQFIARPVRVEGLSMYPSLNDKELGFSNILSMKMKDPERFDVLVLYLDSQKKHIVKRVIGLPGEVVEIRDEKLYIDGKEVEQPFLDTDYVREMTSTGKEFSRDFGPIKVPEGEYFMLGDNRIRSSDSRDYGTFKRDAIKSKDVFVFVPFNKIRTVGK